MKTLNVNMALNTLYGGGTAYRTLQLSKYLLKNGIACTVLTLDLGLSNNILKSLEKASIITLPYINRRYFIPWISLDLLRRINHIIQSVDVIHIIGNFSIINALAYIFARRLKKPYVLCPAGSLIVHGRSRWLKHLFNLMIGKRIIRDAVKYIAITVDEIAQMREYGINHDEIVFIPNGVSQDEFMIRDGSGFRSKFGLGDSPFILFVGTFSSIKGPDLLLKAFYRVSNKFPSYHLVFAGTDRGMLPELKDYVEKNKLQERVHFVGYIGDEDKPKAYRTADLLVVPSRHEAMSMVAIEAGVCGTPVLLTDQCGFGEITEAGGGLVVPASINGIENGLIEILSDPDELKKTGAKLERYIRSKYTWDIIIRRYIKVYNEILTNECSEG